MQRIRAFEPGEWELFKSLLEAALGWLRERGLTTVELWVTEGNGPAETLYRAFGFECTGATGELREGPELRIGEMRREVGALLE